MKKSIRTFFSFILAFSILISSSGVVLAVHTCFSSSKTQISLFHPKGCCSKPSKSCHKLPASGFKSKCCELKISYHRIEVNADAVHHAFPVTIAEIDLPLFSSAVSPVVSIPSNTFNKAPPEILTGTSFLYSIHRLLI
ncbi:MAG: hypothetical protein KA492_01155 [Bacteroidia bacterium]|nr:hypothetical protein [Bacteroidia bacterium]